MLSIGPVEFVILVVIALIVFGPERLPEAAKKAAATVRQLRRMANDARNDLADELGPEVKDLNLNDLRDPRRAMQKYVLDDVDEDDVRVDKDLDVRKDLEELDDEDTSRSTNGNGARRRSRRSTSSSAKANGSTRSRRAGSETDGEDDPEAEGTSTADSSDPEGEATEMAHGRRTMTLTQNERPPFDPDAT